MYTSANSDPTRSTTFGSFAATQKVWVLALVGSEPHSNPLTVVHPLPFSVGRKPGNSLQVNSRTVSSSHAELSPAGDTLLLTDLESTNGTFVNGQRVCGSVELRGGEYLQFADIAFRLRCEEAATPVHTESHDACDQALALVQFDRLIENRLVTPYFQPIVRLEDCGIIAYEVLARSRLLGLESSTAMFTAAGRLNMECELSAMLRWEAVHQNLDMPLSEPLYLNTHPRELQSDDFLAELARLRHSVPNRPLMLEIHEAAVTSPARMQYIRSRLSELDIQLAYDDFGAGQNRLAELCESPPDVLKFDMALIRGLDHAPQERKRMLGGLVAMVHDLGVRSLAEGIETEGEAYCCRDLGFELGQGFYYGRPAPPPRGSYLPAERVR